MSFRENLGNAEDNFLEHLTAHDRSRRVVELEEKLHQGFKSWTRDHSQRYRRIGRMPYAPTLFDDQMIDKSYRPINAAARRIAKVEADLAREGESRGQSYDKDDLKRVRPAIYLARTAYLAGLKKLHAKTVGSQAVSAAMIDVFHNTPAYADQADSPSLVGHVVECYESPERRTVGLTSAHLAELADIAEFSSALNIAIAEEHGFRYIDRVDTLINGNMTRQTYKVAGIPIYLPWLVATGTGVRWGVPPGESAAIHNVDEESMGFANEELAKSWFRHIKDVNTVFAYVPPGSAAKQIENAQTHALEKILLKDASYTRTFAVRCLGGLIVANRFNDQIAVSSIIDAALPEGRSKKAHRTELTDELMRAHAEQAAELTGVPVEFSPSVTET